MQNLKPHDHSPAFGVVRYSVACLTAGPCIIQIICVDCLQISEQKQSSKDIQLFRERLSEEMRLQQSRKVIWDMINTLFVMTEAVEPTFVAFL